MTVADRRPTIPAYPSIGLADAVERVRTLYEQAHRRRLSREEIAKLLGYAGLNGASVETISNLTKYGLIEGRKDDIRVSDDAAVILIEPSGSPDRAAALRRVARRPELFAELAEDFEGIVLPAENAVRVRLERRGFTPRAAQFASRAYRETLELVASEAAEYNQPQAAQTEDGSGGPMQLQPTAAAAPSVPQAAVLAVPAQGFKQDVFTLPEGDVVLRWPEGLSQASLPDLQDWLEVMQRKIARAIGAQEMYRKIERAIGLEDAVRKVSSALGEEPKTQEKK